jgi:hypothetical protein
MKPLLHLQQMPLLDSELAPCLALTMNTERIQYIAMYI